MWNSVPAIGMNSLSIFALLIFSFRCWMFFPLKFQILSTSYVGGWLTVVCKEMVNNLPCFSVVVC